MWFITVYFVGLYNVCISDDLFGFYKMSSSSQRANGLDATTCEIARTQISR